MNALITAPIQRHVVGATCAAALLVLLPWGCEPCEIVLASDYDQSCTYDSDCTAVGQVSACPAGECDSCPSEAVNNSAAVAYKSALSSALSSASGETCECPCDGLAVCRAGKCQVACVPPPSDTLAACSSVGGICGYSMNTLCSKSGPSNACAYSDEICCLD
jgi:hypothetical protein